MKKNYILSLLVAAMLLPFNAVKAQYDAGDSTVCYNIMTNNFTANTALNWTDPNPGNWLGVVWNAATPKRIIQLELHENGNNMGSSQGGNVGLAVEKYTNINGSGVNSELTGVIDFSALTELFALDLRRQEFITSINVTGLNNLAYFMMCRANGITALDMSNLPNLQHIHTSNMDALLTLDVSNCPRLKKLMVKRGSATLTNVNVSGSDSIRFLNLKESISNTSPQTSFDLTGKTQLYHLHITEANISSFPGLSTCNQLTSFRVGKNKLIGTININDFDATNLYYFGVSNNEVDAITGWTSQVNNANLERMKVGDNHLTLNNAIQLANEVNNNASIDADPQIRYGADTIPVGTTLDYSAEAMIDISGTGVASSFQLFDFTGTPVGAANSTGIFTFPTVGEFYIEMTNSGAAPNNESVDLTTNNFWVRCISSSTSQLLTICAGDTATVSATAYTATGTYYNYYATPALCDSVYITDLTVEPAITGNQSPTICAGSSFTIGTSTYSSAGVYTDVFTAADGCDSTVTTNLAVLPSIDTSITKSGQTLISNTLFDPTVTYQWIDCNNNNAPLPGETNSALTAINGSYAVVITKGNCSDTSSCYNITTPVGVNELSSIIANIYPNPITNQFTIELGTIANNTQLRIVNVEGKVVYNENNLHSNKLIVNSSTWSKGIYIIKITNDKYTKTLKLIK